MLQSGVISKSTSPWAAPVVLVTKKDGTIRFCVDYKALNKITVKDKYPLPYPTKALARLRGMKYFTVIDLAAGFWQIELDDESKLKTAFICKQGLFQFNTMPFGLTNAPATLQRLMDEVLKEGTWTIAEVYMDNFIIGFATYEDHKRDVAAIFDRLSKFGLKIKLSKCKFFQSKASYLGHTVNKDGIKPDTKKIEAIIKMPAT